MAGRMIYEKDLAGFGISEIAANQIANDIMDVSVDQVYFALNLIIRQKNMAKNYHTVISMYKIRIYI